MQLVAIETRWSLVSTIKTGMGEPAKPFDLSLQPEIMLIGSNSTIIFCVLRVTSIRNLKAIGSFETCWKFAVGYFHLESEQILEPQPVESFLY